MPKIVITAEFDSVAEARNFLAERTASNLSPATQESSALSQTSFVTPAASNPAPPSTQMQQPSASSVVAATAPIATLATAQPQAPQPSVATAQTLVSNAASPSDPRTLCREAMNAYAAKGHDVPQISAIMMEIAGVKGIRHAPDDKLAALTEAFRTRP